MSCVVIVRKVTLYVVYYEWWLKVDSVLGNGRLYVVVVFIDISSLLRIYLYG